MQVKHSYINGIDLSILRQDREKLNILCYRCLGTGFQCVPVGNVLEREFPLIPGGA